ncbi:hypothetical protein NYR52_03430 [Laceyella sacchari]|uniref:Methylguanine DNA methyltransferase ribonuclease-like domain-containing protein n=1 Tax=Laceyella sacchari TaxID=37482 RepID=A0ABY5U3J9_LACSH|nr:hypothetical protein [Laceyella sacchari]UWE04226.1 hypothetical protein NYR52_03430 [Laceyella sacchari]
MTPGSQSIVWSQIDSPIGPLTLVASHHGLCHIMFSRKNSPTRGLQMWLNNWFPNPRLERNDNELQPYIIQLE